MKNQNIKIFLGAFLAFSLIFVPVFKAVASEPINPQTTIKSISYQLKEKLQDDKFIHDFEKVNVFVDNTITPHVDFKLIAKLVLGKIWKKANATEKERFIEQFKILLIRSYARAFVGFKDWSIQFVPLKIKPSDTRIIIKTKILQRGVSPITINYRMILANNRWTMYDIMIEGISLVINYRASINHIFKKTHSMNGIINYLSEKNTDALAK